MPLQEMSIYTEKTLNRGSTSSGLSQLSSYKSSSSSSSTSSPSTPVLSGPTIASQKQYEMLSMKLPIDSVVEQTSTLLEQQGQKWSDVIDFNKVLEELRLAELRLNGAEIPNEDVNASKNKEQAASEESADNRRWRHKNLRQVQRLDGNDIHDYGIVPKATALRLAVCDVCVGVYTVNGLKRHFKIHHPTMWSNLPTRSPLSIEMAASSISRTDKQQHYIDIGSENKSAHFEAAADTTLLSSSSSMSQLNAELFGSSPSDGTMSTSSNISSCSTSNIGMSGTYNPSSGSTSARQKSARGGQSSTTSSSSGGGGDGSGNSSKSGGRSRNRGKHHKGSSEQNSSNAISNSLSLSNADPAMLSNTSAQTTALTSTTPGKKNSKRKHAASSLASISTANFENINTNKGSTTSGAGTGVNALAATTKEPSSQPVSKTLNNVVRNNATSTIIGLNCNANSVHNITHNRNVNSKNSGSSSSSSSNHRSLETSGQVLNSLIATTQLTGTYSTMMTTSSLPLATASSSSNSSVSSSSYSLPPTPKLISSNIQEAAILGGQMSTITEHTISPTVLGVTTECGNNSMPSMTPSINVMPQNYENSSIKASKKKVKKSTSSHSSRKSSHSSSKEHSMVVSQKKDHPNKITIVKLPPVVNKDTHNYVQQELEQQYRAQIMELDKAVSSITDFNTEANDYNHQQQLQLQQHSDSHSAQQQIENFTIQKHHSEMPGDDHETCTENDGNSLQNTHSSEDSVMLKHVLEEFNMLDSKVINEILNSSENDLNFDETQLSDTTNGISNTQNLQHNHQQQQQQQQMLDMYMMESQGQNKRMRYDEQLMKTEQQQSTPMMMTVSREDGQYTIYPQHHQQEQPSAMSTSYTETIYSQPNEESQQIGNHYQQNQNSMEAMQLQNLMYQQQHQHHSVVAYETVVEDYSATANQISQHQHQQQQLNEVCLQNSTDGDHNHQHQQQDATQLHLLTEMNGESLKEEEPETEVYTTVYTEVGNDDHDNELMMETFEIETVPSLTDENDDRQAQPRNTYVIASQDNESQYQIYEINGEQRCVELMPANHQSSYMTKMSNEMKPQFLANQYVQCKQETKPFTTSEEGRRHRIAEMLRDFDYSRVELVNANVNSKTENTDADTDADAEMDNVEELEIESDQYTDTEISDTDYCGIPIPYCINTFGLRKLPNSVSTTFAKNLQSARKTVNSLTSLTLGARSNILGNSKTSFVHSTNYGFGHNNKSQATNNYNPVANNGMGGIINSNSHQLQGYYSHPNNNNLMEGNGNWMNGVGATVHNNTMIPVARGNTGNRLKISSSGGMSSVLCPGPGPVPGPGSVGHKHRFNSNESLTAVTATNSHRNDAVNNLNATVSNGLTRTILVSGSASALYSNQLRCKEVTARNGFLHRKNIGRQMTTDNNNRFPPLITTNALKELLNNKHSSREMRGLLKSREDIRNGNVTAEESMASMNGELNNQSFRVEVGEQEEEEEEEEEEEDKNYPLYLINEDEEENATANEHGVEIEEPTSKILLMNNAVEGEWNGQETIIRGGGGNLSRVNNFYERRRKLLYMGRQQHHQQHQHQLQKQQLLQYQPIDAANTMTPIWQQQQQPHQHQQQQQQPHQHHEQQQQFQQQQMPHQRLFQQSVTRNLSDCGINSNTVTNNVAPPDVNVMQVFV